MLSIDIKKYLAGFFDGEGCIYINKQRLKSNRKDYISYSGAVAVSNTQKEPLELFAKYFGSKVRFYTEILNGQDRYFWRITSKQAVKFCKIMKDELLLKSEQAEIVIKLHETMKLHSGIRISDEEIKRREKLYLEIRELNKTRKVN